MSRQSPELPPTCCICDIELLLKQCRHCDYWYCNNHISIECLCDGCITNERLDQVLNQCSLCINKNPLFLTKCLMCNDICCMECVIDSNICLRCEISSCRLCGISGGTYNNCTRCAECDHYYCEDHSKGVLCLLCNIYNSNDVTKDICCLICNRRLAYIDRQYHSPCLRNFILELIFDKEEKEEFNNINHDYKNLIFVLKLLQKNILKYNFVD